MNGRHTAEYAKKTKNMASLPVATICDMEFPKASPEEYELEQKRENLYHAEQELASFITFADDFFASPTEKEETLERIRQNPEAILTSSEKPFMKKIARAMMNIATLTKEVEDATEMVADQHLSPEVKAHIHKVCKEQQVFLEKKMEERLAAERVSMMAYFEQQMADMKAHFERQLVTGLAEQKHHFEHQLAVSVAVHNDTFQTKLDSISKEVEVERKQQKAFQAKVKDFSEEVYLAMALAIEDLQTLHGTKHKIFDYHEGTPIPVPRLCVGEFNVIQHIKNMIGITQFDPSGDFTGTKNFIVYKRANVPTLVASDRSDPKTLKEKKEKLRATTQQFKWTTF